jgi:hypothetical protein
MKKCYSFLEQINKIGQDCDSRIIIVKYKYFCDGSTKQNFLIYIYSITKSTQLDCMHLPYINIRRINYSSDIHCSGYTVLQKSICDRSTNQSYSIVKIAVFWVVAPCSLVEVHQRFRGPCCLHPQGDESSP